MTDRHSYLGNYARTDKAWQPLTSPATIIRAYATIQAICNGKETSIPLLQSVLSLSAHPEALHLLTDRSLIEGCIQYLDQQRKADSRYPFGCEQGYLYFRIVVLAVGVSVLSRNKRMYNVTIDRLHELKDPTAKLMTTIVEVTSEMNEEWAAPELDSFLGLSSDGLTSPMMGLSSALLLLRILWDDRKRFLVAWAYSNSPPLNGLFILLWRFARIRSTDDVWLHLCDLFGRHCLVAESDNIFALRQLSLDASKRYHPWLPRETVVDLEDARSILMVFAARMTPGSPLHRTLGPSAIMQMVKYALPVTELQLGTEDLFVPVLRALFGYFWRSKILGTGVSTIGDLSITILMPVCAMLGHLVKHRYDAREILNVTAELGFIEAMAQGMVLTIEDPLIEQGSNQLVVLFQTYTSTLASLESSTYQEAYAGLFVEWFKTLQCLSLRDRMLGTNYQEKPPIIVQYWLGLGKLLGYGAQVAPAEALIHKCTYTRCPDPYQIKSALLECPCEQGVVYCGMRCQQADWATGYLPTSHCHTCFYRK